MKIGLTMEQKENFLKAKKKEYYRFLKKNDIYKKYLE